LTQLTAIFDGIKLDGSLKGLKLSLLFEDITYEKRVERWSEEDLI